MYNLTASLELCIFMTFTSVFIADTRAEGTSFGYPNDNMYVLVCGCAKMCVHVCFWGVAYVCIEF